VERFGRLDCVVNNAGAGGEGGPIAQTSVERFDRSIALLLRGPFLGIKYAVPRMPSESKASSPDTRVPRCFDDPRAAAAAPDRQPIANSRQLPNRQSESTSS
jgi:NAD(P)-dependent dehydrogenase (short-subunit alcohol dehydrogenase family)